MTTSVMSFDCHWKRIEWDKIVLCSEYNVHLLFEIYKMGPYTLKTHFVDFKNLPKYCSLSGSSYYNMTTLIETSRGDTKPVPWTQGKQTGVWANTSTKDQPTNMLCVNCTIYLIRILFWVLSLFVNVCLLSY